MKNKKKPFDIEEFVAIFEKLQKSGWQPKICDSEVPIYDSEVPCGTPDDVNSEILAMASVPREFIKDNPVFMVKAKGDSMVDVSIMDGDVLLVEYGRWPQEQDTVLAYVNGEATLKTFHTAGDGTHWLVPNNEKKGYKAIALDDSASVKIAGVLVGSFKNPVRASYRKCEEVVRQTRQVNEPEPEISELKVSLAIRTIAERIKAKRQWYPVYWELVSYDVVNDGDYEGFCDRIKLEVPSHQHLPNVAELQRMAVMSFVKPVKQWSETYAPVRGKRFKDYKNIALETEKILLQK